MDLVGSTLGKFQVGEELGQGGMAVVYKGYNPALQRTVALKVLREELTADQEFVQRFVHEARTAAQLKHPNIATIYDVEQEGDIHYIVMEFLPGHTLQEELRRRAPLPIKRAAEIVRALADALDYAHQRRLTHRDVKPSNVMLGPDGQVTLMDFGIVKAAVGIQLTQEGVRIGTPEYMSPEQAEGKKLDRRSDIYSLGLVLYEMLVGRVPFQAATVYGVLFGHLHEEPPPPSQFLPGLSPMVEKVVLQALAKSPAQRFQTAGQLAAALEQAVLQASGPALAGVRRRESKLKLVAADGREYHLAGLVGLGRSLDNQVQVADTRISRHHAQIRSQEGRCQIADLGSVNGTFVNDERLRPNVPCLLRPGDRVRLGPEMTFTVGVGTAVERIEKLPLAISLASTLRQKVWEDKRSRAIALLSGGIALLLAILYLATMAVTTGSGQAARPTGTARALLTAGATQELARLTVVNATGHDLELRIGSSSWDIKMGQQQPIRFPPGEYDYTVTLDNGRTIQFHRTWKPGDNGQLHFVAEGP